MPAPPWVAKGLSDILGLDTETVREVIVPDLEGYSSEVRLRGHLLDFLGTTPEARAFSDKYTSFRFPSLASTSTPRILTPDPDLVKPKKEKKPKASSKPASGRATPTTSTGPLSADALANAFGSGGRVYQKHQDDLFPSRGGSASGVARSTPGSGAHTPAPLRRGGAITVVESKAKAAVSKDKGKSKEDKIWDLPKSEETKRLEGIVSALRAVQSGEGKAAVPDKPPCFCQARVHPISTYTPQCAACGLILCELQPAHAACPSCARPTLSPPALARLIQRVEGDVAAQLVREEDEREHAEQLRKERLLAESGGGAFPSLPGGPGGGRAGPSAADVTRRVLTIGKPAKGKGKGKATITTTTYTSVPMTPSSSSNPGTPAPPPDDTIPRPRSPPLEAKRVAKELAKALAWREDNDRQWGDPKAERRGEMWEYIPPLLIELPGEEGTGRRRRANNKKKAASGTGMDGRVVVGAR